jgi:hypothetical protein
MQAWLQYAMILAIMRADRYTYIGWSNLMALHCAQKVQIHKVCNRSKKNGGTNENPQHANGKINIPTRTMVSHANGEQIRVAMFPYTPKSGVYAVSNTNIIHKQVAKPVFAQ